MRRGKWPFSDLFSVHGWPYRAQKGRPWFDIFPMFLVFFFAFSHYVVTMIWACFIFHIYWFPHIFTTKYSTTQHTTYTIHNHTHAHTHAHLPLTVILRVVWVRVTRGKSLENAWKRQSQGNLWRRLVSISMGKSFACGKVAKDESNHTGAGSLRNFPHFSWKSEWFMESDPCVLDLFSNFKWARSNGYSRWTSRANDNSTWTNQGKQKIGLFSETVFLWIGPPFRRIGPFRKPNAPILTKHPVFNVMISHSNLRIMIQLLII